MGDFRTSGGRSSLRKPSLTFGFAPFEKTPVMLKGRGWKNGHIVLRNSAFYRKAI
ncbi:MAG: hypothetical protein ACQESM_02385 [Bacteroidota bacterium]